MVAAGVENEHGRARRCERSGDREAGGRVCQREPGDDIGDQARIELQITGEGREEAAHRRGQGLRQEDRAVLGPQGAPRRDAGLAGQHEQGSGRYGGEVGQDPDGCRLGRCSWWRLREQRGQQTADPGE
jgi:hypothetical protein